MHVEDLAAVVGQIILSQHRLTTHCRQLACNQSSRHRDYLHRQWKASESVYQLAVVCDADEAAAGLGDDLFPRERAPAALDQLQVTVGFIGSVDIDRKLVHGIQVEYLDAVLLEALGRRLGAGNRCLDSPFHPGGKDIDEVIDGGAGAHAEHGAGLYIFEGGFGRNAFLVVGSHFGFLA